MDVKTAFVLLLSENILILLLLIFHRRSNTEPAVSLHLRSQAFTTLSIGFAILRLFSNLWIFPFLNSVLLLAGSYFEALALLSLADALDVRSRRLYGTLLGASIFLFALSFVVFPHPFVRVIVFSFCNTVILVHPAVKVLKSKDPSPLRLLLGALFILMMAGFVIRIIDAIRLGPALEPLGSSFGELTAVASLLAYAILGGVGIILLAKEKTDRQLLRMYKYDRHTQVLNRDGFIADLEERLEKANYHNFSFAVALCDIDKLDEINDAKGHETGDAVILHAATRLDEAVEKGGFVGRMGGDDFMVYQAVENEASVRAFAKTLIEAVKSGRPEGVEYSLNLGVVWFEYPAGRKLEFPQIYSYCASALGQARRRAQRDGVAGGMEIVAY